MVLPIIYRKNPGYDVKFDWVDFATGNGYIDFYGADAVTPNPTHNYFLTTNSNIDSTSGDNALTATGIKTYAANTTLDIDFDVTFQIPIDVAAGIAYVNYTMKFSANDNIGATITIYHVTSGGTETSLGSNTHLTDDDDGSGQYFRDCHKITTTAKHFAAGEKLRINFNAVVEAAEAIYLFHDPSSSLTFTDSMGRTVGSDFVAAIPFKVNN